MEKNYFPVHTHTHAHNVWNIPAINNDAHTKKYSGKNMLFFAFS